MVNGYHYCMYVVATIIICASNHQSVKLSNVSNEINLICKIVEIEQSRIFELKKAIDNFIKNASLSYQITNKKDTLSRLKAINTSFQLLNRCFLVDEDKEKKEYLKVSHCAACFYKNSVEICKWLDEEYDGSESDVEVQKCIKKYRDSIEFF